VTGGVASAALDELSAWLAPIRQRRVVGVPNFRGLHVVETFLIALQTGVKVGMVRLARHPAPVAGFVVKQDPRHVRARQASQDGAPCLRAERCSVLVQNDEHAGSFRSLLFVRRARGTAVCEAHRRGPPQTAANPTTIDGPCARARGVVARIVSLHTGNVDVGGYAQTEGLQPHG